MIAARSHFCSSRLQAGASQRILPVIETHAPPKKTRGAVPQQSAATCVTRRKAAVLDRAIQRTLGMNEVLLLAS
jgi:hypothetical protein